MVSQHCEDEVQAIAAARQAHLPFAQLRLQHSEPWVQEAAVAAQTHAWVDEQFPLQQSPFERQLPTPHPQAPFVQTPVRHPLGVVHGLPTPMPPQTLSTQLPEQHSALEAQP